MTKEEAIKIIRSCNLNDDTMEVSMAAIPELAEDKDERIRKELIEFVKSRGGFKQEYIAWLEKQNTPAKLSKEERNRFSKGVLSECAMSFINYLDSNKREGKMCVSNMECEDIENAFHNGMWDRLYGYHCKYIEKQDEQKSADKVGPKFKVGDWVINEHGFVMQIVDVQDSRYVYMYEGEKLSATIEQMEDSCHLWGIGDANDGDVLVTRLIPEGDWTGIYKQSTETNGFNTYCFLNSIGEFVINPNRCKNHGTYGLHPATREQRELLFQKMEESGYEWDVEKKELRKIEQDPVEQKPKFCHHEVDFSNCSEEYRKAYYDGWNNCNQQHEQMKNLQKPTWSDYDEERYLSCLQRLRTSNLEQPETINTVWLKSLRDRITLTNKNDFDRGYDVGMSAAKFNQWRPTREQLGALIDVLLACENPKTYTLLNSLYNDLKKL